MMKIDFDWKIVIVSVALLLALFVGALIGSEAKDCPVCEECQECKEQDIIVNVAAPEQPQAAPQVKEDYYLNEKVIQRMQPIVEHKIKQFDCITKPYNMTEPPNTNMVNTGVGTKVEYQINDEWSVLQKISVIQVATEMATHYRYNIYYSDTNEILCDEIVVINQTDYPITGGQED